MNKPRITIKTTPYCTVIRTKSTKFGFDSCVLSNREIAANGMTETFLRELDRAVIGGYPATARKLGRMAEYMGVQA